MKLIDADAFKKQIAGMTVLNNYPVEKANKMCELIDAQPEGFDMDGAIKELEGLRGTAERKASEYDEAGKLDLMDRCDAEAGAYKNAVKIIKQYCDCGTAK